MWLMIAAELASKAPEVGGFLPELMAGCFGKTEESKAAITFENEERDYAQRIRYWREGKELVAEIAMKDGSKAVSWRYTPIGD